MPEGKIAVQLTDSNMAHAATDANWVDGFGNYQQYYFVLKANQGYCWMLGSDKIDTMTIFFTIKKQILQTPTLKSASTTLTYQHTFDANQNEYVGVPQGLVYDLHGNDAYIIQSQQQTEVRNDYEWNISISSDYRENYTFLVEGVEQDCLAAVPWSIVPMRIGINEIAIDDPTHYDDTTQSYHYTYTGNEILPTTNIPNEIINAFNISGCTNASDDAQSLTIQVKDYLLHWDEENTRYILQNYAWQNGNTIVLGNSSYLNLPYYIDPAQTVAPTGFANNNVQIKEQTYELSGNLIGLLFLNPRQIADLEYLAFTDDSYTALNNLGMFDGTFVWDVEQPYSTNLVIGNNSLTIKWFATQDIDNYIPIDIPVTVVLNPRVLVFEPDWNTTTGQAPTINLYNSYDNSISEGITYTTYYDLNDYATITQAPNFTDAGYYTTIATLPENANYIYKDTENNTITSFTKKWRVYPTNIWSDYSIWGWTTNTPNAGTSFNGFISFYTDDTDDRTMTFNTSQFSNDFKTYYKIADASYVTYIYNAGTDEWSVAQNTHAIGTYKTVLTIPFNTAQGKATNYCVNDGYYNNANNDAEFTSPEWEIMPITYTFQTTNCNADNYLGKPATDPVYYCDGDNHVPTLDLPSGLYLDYMIDHNPTYDDEHGTWQPSGSSSSYEPSDVGDYLLFAYVKIRQVYGSASVTFTVDGGAAVTTYDLPNLHFSIVEPTPTNYIYGDNNFSMTPVAGYNYITFTTPDVENAQYIMLSNASLRNGWIWIRQASSTKYETVYDGLYTTDTYYYIFTGLSANTEYVVKFSYSTNNNPSTLHLLITQYNNKVSYADGQNDEAYANGLTAALTSSDKSLITNTGGIDILTTLIDGSNNKYVAKINENAFNAEIKTDLGLENLTTVFIPDSVTEIGANAFKGCSNLTTVIFGGGYWHWAEPMNGNKIIFGQDCFAGCSQDLTIYFVSDAQYYHLNADGTLGDPIEQP